MGNKGNPILIYQNGQLIGKFDKQKDAIKWLLDQKNEDNTNKFGLNDCKLRGLSKYMKNKQEGELFFGLDIKYYRPDPLSIGCNNDDDIVNINTIKGRVYSNKFGNGNYDFINKNISDDYKITRYGHFYNDCVMFDPPIGESIQTAIIQICGITNIRLFYLLAIAFGDNPNNYKSAELRENNIKVDKFFKGFDARRDIKWIPFLYQKNEKEVQENESDYTVVYINESIEYNPPNVFDESSTSTALILPTYDSIQHESCDNNTYRKLINYPEYEIDMYGHVRNATTKHKIKTSITSTGYYKCRYGDIHTLVAETFKSDEKPVTDKKLVINHINGCIKDNRPINLEFVTYKRNNEHMHEMHPHRPLIPDRRGVIGKFDKNNFESVILHQLFMANNVLKFINVDSDNKLIIVNKYIYEDVVLFESVWKANKYFEGLGFPKCNSLSHNISIDKNLYGYKWNYEETNYENEEWKNLHDIRPDYYNLFIVKNCKVSNYGRFIKDFDKKYPKIINPSLFADNNYSINLELLDNTDGKKYKEYIINIIVAMAFKPPRDSSQKNVIHLDGNNKNYYYENLVWQ